MLPGVGREKFGRASAPEFEKTGRSLNQSGHKLVKSGGCCRREVHRRKRIKTPAAIATTASTVVTVGDTRTFSSGNSPVSINHTPSKSSPRFLPAKLLVNAIVASFSPASVDAGEIIVGNVEGNWGTTGNNSGRYWQETLPAYERNTTAA